VGGKKRTRGNGRQLRVSEAAGKGEAYYSRSKSSKREEKRVDERENQRSRRERWDMKVAEALESSVGPG